MTQSFLGGSQTAISLGPAQANSVASSERTRRSGGRCIGCEPIQMPGSETASRLGRQRPVDRSLGRGAQANQETGKNELHVMHGKRL